MKASTGVFIMECATKSPMLMNMLREVAEFEYIILELSTVSGLSMTACADIVRNTAKDTGDPWRRVAAHLKWKAMKGGKIGERGR